MIPATWFNSLSPGNEQVLYFGSQGRTVQGTRNYPGIADPAVDAAIQAMLDATRRKISSPPSTRRTGCSSRASTRCRCMMPAASGWRAGTASAAPRRSRCRASRRRRCGVILEITGEIPPPRLNLARYCLCG